MVAKKKKSAPKSKRPRRPKSVLKGPAHVDGRLKEHMETVARLHELICRCTELRDAGRLPAARKVFKQVEQLQKAMQAMEEAMRRHPPA